MAVNGHSKGSTFERKICTLLSKWWTNGERDDIFWRSAGSGARATTRHRKGLSTSSGEGDIACIDPIGKPLTDVFCIELKCGYGDWNLLDFLETNQKKTQFEEFWDQAFESAQNAHAWPMLIYKRDRKNEILVIPSEVCGKLKDFSHFQFHQIRFSIYHHPASIANFWACKLEDFLAALDPETIKELAKEMHNAKSS